MIKFLRPFLLLFALLAARANGFAQDTVGQSIDAAFRGNDKIYVVMAVCLLILVVILLYLIRIDIKISAKEKQL